MSMQACTREVLLLFLDFDGVLHPLAEPTGDGRGRPYTGPPLVHAPLLAALLDPWIDRIEIVLSTTWARRKSLDEIRTLLPESLGRRIVGSIWDTSDRPPSSRFDGIHRWIESRVRQDATWIALDDDARGWPTEMRAHLVWCHAPLGDPSVQSDLLERLAVTTQSVHPMETAYALPPRHVAIFATSLLDRWQVTNAERSALLGMEPSIAAQGFDNWSHANLESARGLLALHAALRLLFPDDPALRYTWIRRRNRELGGRSPLAIILEAPATGIGRVSQLLRAQLIL